MRGLRWVPASGRLNVNSLGYRPVEGGRENDGTPLYIAQAPHKGVVHPGKASEKLDGMSSSLCSAISEIDIWMCKARTSRMMARRRTLRYVS